MFKRWESFLLLLGIFPSFLLQCELPFLWKTKAQEDFFFLVLEFHHRKRRLIFLPNLLLYCMWFSVEYGSKNSSWKLEAIFLSAPRWQNQKNWYDEENDEVKVLSSFWFWVFSFIVFGKKLISTEKVTQLHEAYQQFRSKERAFLG